MKRIMTCLAAASITFAAAPFNWRAQAGNEVVQLPKDYKAGIHYATVQRGGIREEIFTSRDAIEAAKSGKPFPDGAVIVMEDHRGGQLYRYIVMEKRAGWGSGYPENIRNGDWQYREFRPDGSPNPSEDGTRCMSCHKSQASQDFVFTLDQMKSVR